MQGAPYPAFSKEAQTKMQREESFGNRIKTKLEERYGKTDRGNHVEMRGSKLMFMAGRRERVEKVE